MILSLVIEAALRLVVSSALLMDNMQTLFHCLSQLHYNHERPPSDPNHVFTQNCTSGPRPLVCARLGRRQGIAVSHAIVPPCQTTGRGKSLATWMLEDSVVSNGTSSSYGAGSNSHRSLVAVAVTGSMDGSHGGNM